MSMCYWNLLHMHFISADFILLSVKSCDILFLELA